MSDGINQSALVDKKKQKEIREHEYERSMYPRLEEDEQN